MELWSLRESLRVVMITPLIANIWRGCWPVHPYVDVWTRQCCTRSYCSMLCILQDEGYAGSIAAECEPESSASSRRSAKSHAVDRYQ
jgi:hypothetical protein